MQTWSVVRIQPGSDGWYCRIVRTGSKSYSDILCDGPEKTWLPLCEQLNRLTPQLLEITASNKAP